METRKKYILSMMLFMVATLQSVRAQGTCTAMTADDLYTAVTNNQTVTLGQDITLSSGRLDIDGTTVTLDLNGHTLTRPMTAADADGQVIMVKNSGNLTIIDSGSGGKITGGWALEGGAIYVNQGCTLTIKGGTISGNRAEKDANGDFGEGGGIDNFGTLTMTGGTISGNTAEDGGGICNHTTGTLIMTGGTISGNSATDGGGICNEGTAQISNAIINGNIAGDDGGGIKVYGTANGAMVLSNVTITNNTAQTNGGGISLFKPETPNCTVELKGACTITGNTAMLFGGGIYHHGFLDPRPGPTLKMQDTPVVQNNTPTDVHLGYHQLITLSDAFTTGAHVGVFSVDETQETVFTSGYMACNGDTDPANYFFVSSPTISGNVVRGSSEAVIQAAGYKYVERGWDGTKVTETTKLCESYTAINGNDTSDETGWMGLTNGWYVVTSNASRKVLNIMGDDVHLILCNGTQLTVTGGVKLIADRRLSIYSQPESPSVPGKLIATNDYRYGAAIGGGGKKEEAGALVVHGGTIEARSQMNGSSGIGGGEGAGFHPTAQNGLTVYGGNITATTPSEGAGIGSGSNCELMAGYVTIYGGTVTATGGGNNQSPWYSGAGIGGGDGSPGAIVSIYGGTVIATAGGGSANQRGVGIGCGYSYDGTVTSILTLYDNAMVTAGTAAEAEYTRIFTASERVPACQYNKYVLIEPCTHSGSNFTIDDGTTHHTSCSYCMVGAAGQAETHVFADDGKCLCGLVALKDMADNASVLSAWNEKTVPVSLDGRTLYKDGSWNTLCLPFAVSDFTGTPLEGATVKALQTTAFADGTLTLNFSNDLTAIEAGKPYIVKWTAQTPNTVENPVFNNVTISKTTTDVKTDEVTFKGIFSPYAISGEDKTMLYLDTDDKLCYPNDAMTIGACRAYFQLADGLTAGEFSTAGAKGISHIVLNFGDGVATGVTNTDFTDDTDKADIWYSLDGRRLSIRPTAKGIYIYQGRKVIIK